MKRPLTPAQIEARDARRAKFSAIAKQIADMPDIERADLAARMAGAITIEGRSISAGNACLVALQYPSATVLGGFQQWRQHGRTVRKGQHGLMIWAPTARKADSGAAAPDPMMPADVQTSDRPGFVMVTVFDVSQTDPLSDQPTCTECRRLFQADGAATICQPCITANRPNLADMIGAE